MVISSRTTQWLIALWLALHAAALIVLLKLEAGQSTVLFGLPWPAWQPGLLEALLGVGLGWWACLLKAKAKVNASLNKALSSQRTQERLSAQEEVAQDRVKALEAKVASLEMALNKALTQQSPAGKPSL